jgi:hypothetical protein
MKSYEEFSKTNEEENKFADAEAFAKKVKETYESVFPKSYIGVSVGKLGEPSVLLKIALGQKGEYTNGIIQNDPMHQVIQIEGWNKDGSRRDSFSASNSSKGLMVKSSDPKYAFESIKVWRAFKGDEKKILDGLKKYFEKLKATAKENLDKLPEYVADKV